MDLLHQIIEEEDLYQLKEHLNLGTDPNIKNKDGNTPLHICFYLLKDKHSLIFDIIFILLENNANPMLKNNIGYIPIQCCKFYEKLYDYFFESCKKGDIVTIKYLLLCKINIFSFSDKYNMNALNIALKYKQDDVILLIEDFSKKLNKEYLSLYSNSFHCPQWVNKNYMLGFNGQKMLFEDEENKVKVGIWINNHWNELKTN